MAKDFYEVLGVEKSASAEDIKKAYRKKAHQHHPDKGGDSDKFKEINEAYQVLGDPQKRAQYDQFGSAGMGGNGGPGFGGQGFGFDPSNFQGNAGFGGFGGLGDIFEDLFSQAFSTVQAEIQISPAQAVIGDEMEVKLGDEKLSIKIPAGAQDGMTLRFPGKGNATRRGRGDLHIVIRVKTPSRISREEKELYQQLLDLEKDKGHKKGWFGL